MKSVVGLYYFNTVKGIKKQVLHREGFTIVELLIVVVVIAILAAITIVSFNGITGQAKESALKNELSSAAKQLQAIKASTGSLPLDTSSVKKSDKITLSYTSTSDAFCLSAISSDLLDKPFYITEGGMVMAGTCPASTATTMQTFTSSHCTALVTYTGSNPSAIVSLTDTRGGITQTYEVAKLADGRCWMLNNLKLGSPTAAITLTPSDSNVVANFTLPQLTTSGATDENTPKAYGPVPGNTSIGATNYGYLYNWSAATAGETTTTKPGGSGNAQYSICPKGWRLPSGANVNGDFALLDIAFGGTGAGATSPAHLSKWLSTGPFKGVFSGYYVGLFTGQGSSGPSWSSSSYATSSTTAVYNANYTASYIGPARDYNARSSGYAIRCLLN